MADFSRRAADGGVEPVKYGRLAACLAASSLIHALVFGVDWSSVGPLRILGVAGRSANLRDNRRIDALIVAAVRPPVEVAPAPPNEPAAPLAPPASKPAPVHVPEHAAAPAATQPPAPVSAQPAGDVPGPVDEPAPSLPVPEYFPAEALSRQPELIGNIDETLREPLDAGIRGRVLIRLYLSQSGKPERVKVLESTLPIEIEGLIVHAFFTASYRPGEIDGQPVMSEMTVEVDLSPTAELYVPKPSPAAPTRGGEATGN